VHAEFEQRYHMLFESKTKGKVAGQADISSKLNLIATKLARLKNPGSAIPSIDAPSTTQEKLYNVGIQLGKTLVFLRRYAFDDLEKMRAKKVSLSVSERAKRGR